MRKPVIAGNWKMHKTIDEALLFVKELKETELPQDVETVLCAPFLALPALVEETKNSGIGIGAQNAHYEEQGAYTGEVSLPMLKAAGVQYVILGHSERRAYYNETDEDVNKKTKAAHAHGLIPIVCVGEVLEERESGKTMEVVAAQVKSACEGLSAEEMKKRSLPMSRFGPSAPEKLPRLKMRRKFALSSGAPFPTCMMHLWPKRCGFNTAAV